MEKTIVIMIGVAAVVYLGWRLWRKSKGESGCNCGSENSGCCKGCPGEKK